MPDFISKGGQWVRKEQLVPPDVVTTAEKVEVKAVKSVKKPITKPKPKKAGSKRR